jgi:Polysaccharide pyruvyl transferase
MGSEPRNMSKITVVTAFNPRNAGMYSVDLAAEQFLQSCGHSIRLVRTQSRKTWLKPRFGRQRFDLVRNASELFDTDILVYWGDFTTNLLYGLVDFPRRDIAFGHNKSEASAFESWLQLFLPNRSDRNTPVYSIGQNFHSLGNSLKSLSPDMRAKVEGRYHNTFDAIIPRDDVSMQSLGDHKLGNSGVKLLQGLDPAMLLDHHALYPELRTVDHSNSFAYVFGRSDFLQIPNLLQELEHRSGCKGVNLPFWHDLKSFTADRQMRNMMKTIAAAKFVLTDTYHCAVNAIALGKPVFCLGLNQATQSSTVSEPKKRILFRMMGLTDYYLEFQNSSMEKNDRGLIIDTIMNHLEEQPSNQTTISNLKVEFRETVATILQNGAAK